MARTAAKLPKNLPGSKNCHMHGLSPEGKNKFAAYRFVSLGGKKKLTSRENKYLKYAVNPLVFGKKCYAHSWRRR